MQGKAWVVTRTEFHSPRAGALSESCSWPLGPLQALHRAQAAKGSPGGVGGEDWGPLQIWAWDGGYTFQALPSPLALSLSFFFLTLPG